MTLPAPNALYYPTAIDVRDTYLRSIKGAFSARGLVAATLPGSEHHIRGTALGRLTAISYANNKLAHTQTSPLTATGDKFTEMAASHGIVKRGAAPATGFLVVTVSSGSVVIPAGFQADIDGQKYQTTSANTVFTGGSVAVTAVEGGAATNQSANTVAKWESAALSKLGTNCTVGSAGITGGVDADTEEVLRSRLLERLANPLGGGNWAQVKALAENASASVSAAFVYASPRGPGSVDVAITRNTGDRTLSSVVQSQVASAIAAEFPGLASINVTTVAPEELDVVLTAVLPLPVNAGGAGGGWRDASPWPNATSGNVKVTSYVAATGVATLDATDANGLVPGTQFAIWDPAAEIMREYTASVVLDPGNITVEVQGGFLADPTGAYISTGAVNLASYGTSALAAFRALGPGEKSADVAIVPRALRKPSPDNSSPADTSSLLLADITNEHSELQSLDWSVRYETGTTTTKTAAALPANTSLPPEILTLKHFAIRKA